MGEVPLLHPGEEDTMNRVEAHAQGPTAPAASAPTPLSVPDPCTE